MLLPPPRLEPLKRLCVTDGLLVNAELWHHAHRYHQHRQNVHFQSLFEPGIVYGLGVVLSEAPEQTPSQYRDQRWVTVQPGLAIDLEGNPIVVDEPVAFPIAPIETDYPLTVYLTIRHVDPETLEHRTDECVFPERFRIDQVNRVPTGREVELCRVHLHPGAVRLIPTPDPFQPDVAQLDRRYRPMLQPRPQAAVHVAQGVLDDPTETDQQAAQALGALAQSLLALYSPLRAHLMDPLHLAAPSPQMATTAPTHASQSHASQSHASQSHAPQRADLIYLSYPDLGKIGDGAIALLQHHLETGGTLVIERLDDDARWRELNEVKQEIEDTIATTTQQRGLTTIRLNLETELEACNQTLEEQIEQILADVTTFGQRLMPQDPVSQDPVSQNSVSQDSVSQDSVSQDSVSQDSVSQNLIQDPVTDIQFSDQLTDHLLLQAPFTFGQLPILTQTPIRVFVWHGIILVLGNLSHGWGGATCQTLSRETIRTAQEFGINLLHFAWRRKQFHGPNTHSQ